MRKKDNKNKKINKKMVKIRYKIPNYKKAALMISPKAYIKMMALVCQYETEVQWHGLITRVDNYTWRLNDILVFPHECSSCTVVSNQKEYEEWLDGLSDEDFNQLKLHGHSHVNMSVTPSGVYNTIINGNNDESYRARLISSLPSNKDFDNYYIFVIMNKKQELSARIYDLCNDIVFDTSKNEIDIKVEGIDIQSFIEDARRIATIKQIQIEAAPHFSLREIYESIYPREYYE